MTSCALPTLRAPRALSHLRLLALLVFAAAAVACGNKPEVTFTAPEHGAFSNAASIEVTGEVAGLPLESAQLAVNGNPVAIQPDKTWSTTLPLDSSIVFNPVLAELVNTENHRKDVERMVVIAGEAVTDGFFSPESIALRLNDSGLDSVEPVVSDLVDLDLATLLPVGTQVISNFCAVELFGGCIGEVDVAIANPAPSFSSFGLNVDSMTGFAAGDVNVNDLRVDADVDGSGVAPSCGLRLTANAVTILGDYSLEPSAADPDKVDVNLTGSPGVAFSGFQSEFTSGLCDFPLIGDLIQLIIGDVEPIVVGGLEDFLADPDGPGPQDAPIAEGIETALADINIAGSVGEGLGVQLDAPLFKVEEDVDGITLGSDGRITTSVGSGPGQCEPPEGAPDLAASLHVPEAFPVFGPTTPITNVPYGMGLSISTSALNQLLKAQIECGLLQADLTELDLGAGPVPITTSLLALFIPELGEVAPNPVRVELRPTLAPVLTGQPGPQGEPLELRLGGLGVSLVADGGPLDGNTYLGGQIDFRGGLDLSFDNLTGNLVFSIASVDAQDITVGLTVNPIGTDTAAVSATLQQVLPLILPDLGDALGSFPLPEFLGLEIQAVAVERNGEFVSIFADLVQAP